MSEKKGKFTDTWTLRRKVEEKTAPKWYVKITHAGITQKGTRKFLWELYDSENELQESRTGIILTNKFKPEEIQEWLSAPKAMKQKTDKLDELY
jgi:hypothetical protein